MDQHRRALTTNRLPVAMIVALGVLPITLLVVFYLWPVATLLTRAIDPDAWQRFGTSLQFGSGLNRVIWFTVWQASLSTILTVILGLAPAAIIARYRFVGRSLLLGVVTAMFVLPTVVVGAAFLAVLPTSIERSIWAILAAHAVFNLAVVIRIVGASWQQLDPRLEAAAATLGAGPITVLRTVTLPLLRPSIIAAASIVFVFCFTSFGVIRILGTPRTTTVEVEIWRRATQLGDVGVAAILSIGQLLVLIGIIAWSARAQRQHGFSLSITPAVPTRTAARPAERIAVTVVATATFVVVVTPLLAMVERSLRTRTGYSLGAWRSLGATEIRPGIRLGIDPLAALGSSARIAVVATMLAVIIGGLAALTIDAARRRGALLDVGLMLPLGTSAVTIGFGMLITFSRAPVDWRAAWWLVPVGHALVAVPFVVRTTTAALGSIDPRLRAAAATLGASPTRAWRQIVIPAMWRPLGVSVGLAAAISLGEFGATSFLSRSGSETVPIVIERLIGRTGSILQAQAFALATVLAVATTLAVVGIDLAIARRTSRDAPAVRP